MNTLLLELGEKCVGFFIMLYVVIQHGAVGTSATWWLSHCL